MTLCTHLNMFVGSWLRWCHLIFCSRPIGIDFTVQFAQIFTVQIVQWPESIKLEVFEASGFSNTLLSDVFALIPDASITSDNVQLEELQFSSEQKQGHPREGVGSGMIVCSHIFIYGWVVWTKGLHRFSQTVYIASNKVFPSVYGGSHRLHCTMIRCAV